MTFSRPALRRLNPWLPIAVGPILLFGIDLIRGRALFWGTPLLQFTPWHTAAKEIALSGHLPLWNPWLGMGAPLFANYQSALLYPPNWLLLATDVAWGQTLLVLLHLIWAGFGMALLARSLGLGTFAQAISGIAYAMSGYLVARSGFLSINAAAAWLPWTLYAAEGLVRSAGTSPGAPNGSKRSPAASSAAPSGLLRSLRWRALALLGLVLGIQWLAGHAQVAWYTLVLLVVWAVFRARSNSVSIRRAVLMLAVAGALGFAIAAVQLIPTLEYASISNRAGDLDPEFALTYSFWPWRALGLVAPDLFGNPGTADYWGYGNFWEDAIYVGVLPLLLAIGALATKRVGRIKWFLLAVAAIAFLFGLGSNTPVFKFLFEYVPTFSAFQAPTRWNLWLVASFSLLAGFGAEYWKVAEGKKLYWLRLGTAGAIAILVMATLINALDTDIEPTFTRAIATAGFWLAASGILALLRSDPGRRGWVAAALSVVVLDLFFAGRGLNPTLPAKLGSAPSALSQEIQGGHRLYMSEELEREIKFDVAFRFDSFQPGLDWVIVRESGLPNTPLLDRLRSANNFDPLLPARYVLWMNRLEQIPPAHRERLLPTMDVGWQAVSRKNGLPIYEPIPDPMRAWIVPSVEWVASPAEAVRQATSSNIDLSMIAILEGDPRPEQGGAGEVTGGWLVLADTWFPGWAAELDGQAAESYPANGVMRSVWIPAGQHTVVFRYRPITVPIGLALTVFGLAAFAYLRRK